MAVLLAFSAASAQAWWDKAWTVRKKITIDPAAAEITDPIGTATILVRLHDGNFQFGQAKEDGSDLRFVADDDKTALPYHIERWDSLMNEAFAWVKVPNLKPGTPTSFYIYYGNGAAKVDRADNPKASYDADTVLVYHFADGSAPPADSTALANAAENAGTPSEGSIIGPGLRLVGTPINIPASPSLAWKGGEALTLSAWFKIGALQPDGVLFSRREGGNAFVIGVNNGVPYVEVTDASGVKRSAPGAALEVGAWKHLAVVAEAGKITLDLDGQPYATLAASVPALNSPSAIGGGEGLHGFNGELDELEISKVARPAGFIKAEAIAQGGESAAKLLREGQDESGSAGWFSGGFGLMGVLLKSVTIDGWIVIGVLAIMAVVTWIVMITKFFYLRKVERGTALFVEEWREVAADLTQIDKDDEAAVKTVGEGDEEEPDALHSSPIYRIYHIGSEEISRRRKAGRKGIGPRAFQAIRASLDGGMARESQVLNAHMVFLTIAIAGGPFLGLLGTVVGVMITFAEIAASGEVNINAIAPGIAAALIATVAGLVVAIPALFGYNYLVSKIKEVTITSQVFIDEFVTKMAEFYPPE